MSKHTQGPWQVLPAEDDKPYIRIRGTRLGQRYKVANVVSPVDFMPEKELKETIANARLIAAAPELLEALKLCAGVCAGEGNSKSALIRALEKARSAIQKAEGEQQ